MKESMQYKSWQSNKRIQYMLFIERSETLNSSSESRVDYACWELHFAPYVCLFLSILWFIKTEVSSRVKVTCDWVVYFAFCPARYDAEQDRPVDYNCCFTILFVKIQALWLLFLPCHIFKLYILLLFFIVFMITHRSPRSTLCIFHPNCLLSYLELIYLFFYFNQFP